MTAGGTGKAWAAGATVVVVAAIAAGLWAVGSPLTAREERLDARRIEDLTILEEAIEGYAANHGAPPAALDSVVVGPDTAWLRDPVTATRYDYLVMSDSTYRLCATFDRASPPVSPYTRDPAYWQHPPGKHCFDRVKRKRPDGVRG